MADPGASLDLGASTGAVWPLRACRVDHHAEHFAEGAVPEISTIPVHDTVQAFGKALYGNAWIGKLTVPEARLLRRFPRPGRTEATTISSILPGRVTYVPNLSRSSGLPHSEALQDAVKRAWDRHEEMEEQYRNVHARLESCGFDWINCDAFPLELFKDAFTRDFGNQVLSTHKVSTFGRASNAIIREEIRQIYRAAAYPPNIVQLAKTARQTLKEKGYLVPTWKQIQGIGKEAEFKKLRRELGKTIASERPK